MAAGAALAVPSSPPTVQQTPDVSDTSSGAIPVLHSRAFTPPVVHRAKPKLRLFERKRKPKPTYRAPEPVRDTPEPSAPHTRPPAPPPDTGPFGNWQTVLVAFLKAQVGKPYSYGATGPDAYDCSGLTMAAMAKVGVNLPRTSEEQSAVGTYVPVSNLRPGDLVFWGAPGAASHTAVYIGGGEYIAAENPRTGVVLLSISYYRPQYGRRVR